jgi:hypothetical protein
MFRQAERPREFQGKEPSYIKALVSTRWMSGANLFQTKSQLWTSVYETQASSCLQNMVNYQPSSKCWVREEATQFRQQDHPSEGDTIGIRDTTVLAVLKCLLNHISQCHLLLQPPAFPVVDQSQETRFQSYPGQRSLVFTFQ